MNKFRADIIKDILIKRTRVSIKLSSIANDLAARGRRHDNSYTDKIEMDLLEKIQDSDNEVDKKRNEKLLRGIHSSVNDYLPAFHDGNVCYMNMLQLLEYIAHRVTEYETSVVTDNKTMNKVECVGYVIGGFNHLSEDLSGVIMNTVMYMIDRNESIKNNLPKSSEEISAKILNGGIVDGENEEE